MLKVNSTNTVSAFKQLIGRKFTDKEVKEETVSPQPPWTTSGTSTAMPTVNLFLWGMDKE